MKTGDKVLCKYVNCKHPYGRGFFKVGNLYEIEVVAPMIPSQKERIIFIKDDKNISYSFFDALSTFFYTPQEIRKMKLEKIKTC